MASLNLADIGRMMDPDGKIADMAEILSQCNEMSDDIVWVEGNLPTSHQTTMRTVLPQGTFRRFNQGVGYTRSAASQLTFGMAELVAYSQIDKSAADLMGNAKVLRKKEDIAHMQGFSQQMATTFLYGNQYTNPEQFTGFMPLFNTVSLTTALNAKNVIDGGGTASANTSILLVGWGEMTAYGIYPKGSKAGLQFEDKSDVVPGYDAAGQRFEAYTSYLVWKAGLAIEDWRYVVRICNLDTTTAGLAGNSPPDLYVMLSKAVKRLPDAGKSVSGITKTDANDRIAPSVQLKLYMDRTSSHYLDVQTIRNPNAWVTPRDAAGTPTIGYRGIPIGVMDAQLDTEARVV